MDDKDKKIRKLIELLKVMNNALLEANKILKDNNLPEVNKSVKIEETPLNDFSRSFTISYYFDSGCETVISIQATSRSEAIKEFWKQRPTADRINLIYDSFENYG